MDDEDRKLLREVLEISRENRKKINRLYRSFWWSKVGRLFYWLVIIGITLGSFYYLQPYVDKLREAFSAVESQLDSVQQVRNAVTQ